MSHTIRSTHQFIFNEITHYFVVKVLNRSPLDALLDIFFLLEGEGKKGKNINLYSVGCILCDGCVKGKGRACTCSAFRVSSIKICCSFSFTKLIQNCSNPFLCRSKQLLQALTLAQSSRLKLNHAIHLKNLESVNIQNADAELFDGLLHGFVYGLGGNKQTKQINNNQ